MNTTSNVYQISIEKNLHGFLYFKMTDGIDVAKEMSVEKCLIHFGLDASEESIKEWARIANMNNNG